MKVAYQVLSVSFGTDAHFTPTPSRATWLVLRRRELCKRGDEQLIALLTAQHPELAEAIELGQGFAQLVRTRQPVNQKVFLQRAIAKILIFFNTCLHTIL